MDPVSTSREQNEEVLFPAFLISSLYVLNHSIHGFYYHFESICRALFRLRPCSLAPNQDLDVFSIRPPSTHVYLFWEICSTSSWAAGVRVEISPPGDKNQLQSDDEMLLVLKPGELSFISCQSKNYTIQLAEKMAARIRHGFTSELLRICVSQFVQNIQKVRDGINVH